jgi:hypothetical protein
LQTDGFVQTDFSGTPAWAVSGGNLTMTGGSGSLWKSSANPDPTGALPAGHAWLAGSLTMQSVIHRDASSTTTGIFIGGLTVLYADWASGQYRIRQVDSVGHPNSSTGAITGVTAHDGDTLAICAQQTGANPPNNSTISVTYIVNGVPVATNSFGGIAGTLVASSPTQTSGLWGQQAGQWGTSFLQCGSTCPTSPTTPRCPLINGCVCPHIPSGYTFTLSGVGASICFSAFNNLTLEMTLQISNPQFCNYFLASNGFQFFFNISTTYVIQPNGQWPNCNTDTVVSFSATTTLFGNCGFEYAEHLANFTGPCSSFTLPLTSNNLPGFNLPPTITLGPVG